MDVRALILVGGLGSRLAPVLQGLPKPLVEVGGIPFLVRLIQHLRRRQLHRFILCVGYGWQQIQAVMGEGENWGVTLDYSLETTPRGTAGALKAARSFLTDTFLVFNGDTLLDIDLAAFLDFHRRHGGQATMALTRVDEAGRYGLVQRNASGQIGGFWEKQTRNPKENWINGGVYALHPAVLEKIPEGIACSLEHELFPQLTREGQLFGYPCHGYFIDIGTPESYQRAQSEWSQWV